MIKDEPIGFWEGFMLIRFAGGIMAVFFFGFAGVDCHPWALRGAVVSAGVLYGALIEAHLREWLKKRRVAREQRP